MKQARIIMGMPITVDIVGEDSQEVFNKVFDYFDKVDARFSTYKRNSEISQVNHGEIKPEEYSDELKEILYLAKQTKYETEGYFDIQQDERIDPSGIVKGWAINNAAKILKDDGFKNFYIEAGGDIEASGAPEGQQYWRTGIRNPFKPKEIVKVLKVSNLGVATSGTYERGKHIYNPVTHSYAIEISSLTVIGPNIFDADRFATGAFAMGKNGINFIEKLEDFEGYMIDNNGIATMTSGFEKYVLND